MDVYTTAKAMIKEQRVQSNRHRSEAIRLRIAGKVKESTSEIRIAQYHDAMIEGMRQLARELNTCKQ
jgi:hypothetical protein